MGSVIVPMNLQRRRRSAEVSKCSRSPWRHLQVDVSPRPESSRGALILRESAPLADSGRGETVIRAQLLAAPIRRRRWRVPLVASRGARTDGEPRRPPARALSICSSPQTSTRLSVWKHAKLRRARAVTPSAGPSHPPNPDAQSIGKIRHRPKNNATAAASKRYQDCLEEGCR